MQTKILVVLKYATKIYELSLLRKNSRTNLNFFNVRLAFQNFLFKIVLFLEICK